MALKLEDLKSWMDNKFKEINVKNEQQNKHIESILEKLEQSESQVFDCIIRCSSLEKENKNLRTENAEMKHHLNQIDARTRHQNRRFFNLTDDPTQSAAESLNTFIKSDLKIDVDIIHAQRVVSRNPSLSTKKTHIIARFSESDVQKVQQAAYKRPKGSKGSIEHDLPIAWVNLRRMVYPTHVKPAKAAGKKVRWYENKLYINDRQVYIETSTSDSNSTLNESTDK